MQKIGAKLIARAKEPAAEKPPARKPKKYRSWSIAGSPDVHNPKEMAEFAKQQGWDKMAQKQQGGLTPTGKKIVAKVKGAAKKVGAALASDEPLVKQSPKMKKFIRDNVMSGGKGLGMRVPFPKASEKMRSVFDPKVDFSDVVKRARKRVQATLSDSARAHRHSVNAANAKNQNMLGFPLPKKRK